MYAIRLRKKGTREYIKYTLTYNKSRGCSFRSAPANRFKGAFSNSRFYRVYR